MANKYKKFVATAATATLVASAIVPVASASEKFSDVSDSSEFAPYIYDLADEKVMTGDQGKFNPGKEVTRTAAVKTLGKWLVNVHNYEVPADYATKARFNDLPVDSKDQELVKYAALLKDLGIFTGNEAGNLSAANSLNREQMAKVVVEAFSVISGKTVTELVADFDSKLTDLDKVSASNVDYVKVFEKYGITTVDTFNPKGQVKRQHFAKFLSIAIGSDELAKDIAALPAADLTKALAAVETAVAALPKAEEVTAENAEAATKAVEAVTTAVETATKALKGTEGLTEEETKAAEAKLAAATEAAKAVEAAIEATKTTVVVDSVSAINANQVSIKFAKDAKVTEETLANQKVTLTAGEETVTATYLAESISEGTAVFVLDNEAELKDAVEYTVTGEFTSSSVKFVAAVTDAYAKTLDFITTGMAAKEYDATEATTTTVAFTAKDQYGKEYKLSAADDITVEVKINGVPQTATVAALNTNKDAVVINKTLTEGQTVEVTVTNTVNKEKYTATKTFTVVKAAEAVPTTISNLKVTKADEDVSSVVFGDEITLSVDVRDQFNNKVDADVVTWVVEKGSVEENKNVVGGLTKTYNVDKAGELQISAYLENGQKATFSTTVSAEALTSLSVAEFGTIYNNEKATAELTYNPVGSTLTPAEVTAEVVSAPKGVNASDVKVSVAYGTTEDTEDQIFATLTTPVKGEGEYKVKFSAAGKSVEKTFTSQVNQAVASISVDAIEKNELQQGIEVVKAVTFKNKHGEVVNPTTAKVATTSGISEENVVFYGADAEGKRTASVANGIKFVGITPSADATGEQTVTLVKDSGTASVKGEVVTAGKIKSVSLESAAVSTIKADSYDAEEIAEVEEAADKVAVVDSKAYTLIAVSAVDSYGKARELTLADFDADATAPTGVEYKYFTGLENDDVASASTDVVKYIGVHATADVTGTSVVVKPLVEADALATSNTVASKTITVKAARTLTTLNATPANANILKGKTATIKVSGLDQYNGVADLTGIKVVDAEGIQASVGEADDNGVVAVSVEGLTAGTHTVTIFNNAADVDAPAANDPKVNVSLKVQELESAVQSISLSDEVLNATEKLSAKNLIEVANDTELKLTPVLKDANNEEVDTNGSEVIYSVDAVELKDANGEAVTTATVEATEDGIKFTTLPENVTGTVKVTATTTTGKSTSMTLKVSNVESAVQAGTIYLTSTATGLDAEDVVLPEIAGTVAIKEDKVDTTGARTIYLVGLDQYNQVNTVGVDTVVAVNENVEATKDANGITLTAKKAGSTTVNVFVGGKLVKAITVTATEADVAAATAAAEAVSEGN